MKKTICTAIALAIVSFGTAFAADLNKDDAATIAKDGMGIGMKKAEMIVAERNANSDIALIFSILTLLLPLSSGIYL